MLSPVVVFMGNGMNKADLIHVPESLQFRCLLSWSIQCDNWLDIGIQHNKIFLIHSGKMKVSQNMNLDLAWLIANCIRGNYAPLKISVSESG